MWTQVEIVLRELARLDVPTEAEAHAVEYVMPG